MRNNHTTISYLRIKEYLIRHDELVIFSLSFMIEVLFGLMLISKYGSTLFDIDSISYLYNSRNVIDKGEYSGLSVLVGTWLPFFSLSMVPFVAIDQLYSTGFAGTIVNAAMTGLICVFLYRLAGGRFAVITPVFFLSNVYVLVNGAIPMSEQTAIFFMVAAAYYFKKYLDTGSLKEFITCSVFLIFGSLTRYEIWLIAIYVVSVFIITELRNKKWHRIWYAFLPTVGIAAWLFISYIIHRDAFWFAKNPLGLGVNPVVSFQPETFYFKNSVYLTLNHALIQMNATFGQFLYLAFISVALIIVLKRTKILVPLLVLFIPAAANIVLMYAGKSTGWERYFYTSSPGIVLLIVLLLENLFMIYDRKEVIKNFLPKTGSHINIGVVPVFIILIFVGISIAGAGFNSSQNTHTVTLSRTDNHPWIFQGLDISGERFSYNIEYNKSVYIQVLKFNLLDTLHRKDLEKTKKIVGTEKILLPYPDDSGYNPNIFSVSQGISPSQIIDDFNYLDYENAMQSPWKYAKYVIIVPPSESAGVINQWYKGKFYLYNYDSNQTWRSEFLGYYQPVLDNETFKLFKLKDGVAG